jgi:hypothetical protein
VICPSFKTFQPSLIFAWTAALEVAPLRWALLLPANLRFESLAIVKHSSLFVLGARDT